MKIVFFAHYWLPYHFAGSEVMGQSILRHLQSRGHEVSVIAVQEFDAPDHWEYQGIPAYRPNNKKQWHHLLDDLDPDVIITHHHPTPYATAYADRTRIPIVQVIHNDHHVVHNQLSKGAKLVVYNTKYLRDELTKSFDYPSVVLHPPVWAEDHATDPGDKVTLINLNRDKGSGLFYKLADELPEFEFLAVEGGHGAQIFECWDNVTLQKQTTDMKRDVWANTKVLLVPSIYESYGLVAVEALASGIPVIANPTFGLQESLGPAGIFIDRDDTAAYAAEITRLMKDPEYYKTRSLASLRRSQELDPTKELDEVAARIEELTNGIRNNQ